MDDKDFFFVDFEKRAAEWAERMKESPDNLDESDRHLDELILRMLRQTAKMQAVSIRRDYHQSLE